MSLTNPKDVVTEERLHDFYGQILPYLGGMPEMLANKFSKGDMYSTDERMIGQWIDGKPLYQKVIIKTGTIGASNIAHNISDVDTVFVAFACVRDSNNRFYSMSQFCSGNGHISVNETYVSFAVSTSGWTASNGAIFVLQYTKTTDSAISIGSDTDYSTTEKIVGTWIDGKPLYQKSISMSSWTVEHGISNLGDVISCTGVIKSGNMRFPIPYVSDNVAGYRMTFVVDDTNIDIQHGSGWIFSPVVATIQYTKTN